MPRLREGQGKEEEGDDSSAEPLLVDAGQFVGFEGQELNRFYERNDDGGVTETHQHMVEAGTGVAMLPDDLHSIHIDTPSLNFHCYGLALERLDERVYYDARNHDWKVFNSVSNIHEARPGLPAC